MRKNNCRENGVKWFLILFLGVFIMLSGCAQAEPETDPEEIGSFGVDGYYYEACELAVEGLSDNCLFKPVICGEKIYYARDNRTDNTQPNEYTIFCYDTARQTCREIPVADPDFYWFRTMEADGEGNLYLVLEGYGKKITPGSGVDYLEYELRKLDPQGREIYRRDVTASLMPLINDHILNTMEIDGEGRWYLSLKDCVALYDENGEYWGTLDKGFCAAWGRGPGDRIYLALHEWPEPDRVLEANVYEVDFEKKALNRVCGDFLKTASGTIHEIPESAAKIAVFETYGLYEFDLQDQTLTQLLKWSDSGLEGDGINEFAVLPDGRILVTCFGAGGSRKCAYMLTRTAIGEEAGQQLVIGSLYSNPVMEKAVSYFNRSSENYQVIIRDYSSGQTVSREDAWTLLSGEIAAGKGPDILVLNQLPEPEAYFEKGMLLDLMPWLESSRLLKKENYPEQILSMYTFDGKLLGIPEAFLMQTMMGKKELLGDRVGWTLEEMMSFAGEHKDVRLTEQNTRWNIFSCCLMFNAGSFIEEASAECNFLSPEFMAILEFAASYPETGIAPEDAHELETHLRDGEILLMDVSFSDITGYVYSCLLFGGEPVTCIGYPSPENTVGCLISPNNEVYGILSSSQHPRGAWEFIEAWLAGSLKDENNLSGFPSDTSKLDLMLRKGLDEEYMEKRGMRAVSEEELAALYELIGRAQSWHSWDQAVLQIIVEEAAEYFAGNVTQQEAAEHIQSRVMLYLKEKE